MKTGGRRNYSYGRSTGYAVSNILRDRFGNGRFGTHHSHKARLKPFLEYLRAREIRDLRHVSVEVVADYAEELKDAVGDGCLATATAVNRVSSVNVLLEAARGDKACWVSPRDHIGPRSRVRRYPPLGLDAVAVWAAAEEALRQGEPDLAAAIVICRFIGARIREAALLDLRKAVRSAREEGVVTISRGSKGNRAKSLPRVISVSEKVVAWLEGIPPSLPGRTLVPAGQTFRSWYLDVYRRFGPIAREHGLHTGFHDLRSAYACDRYRQITGTEAPCVAGTRVADKEIDRLAREILAEELGHGRIDVVAAYVGGRR